VGEFFTVQDEIRKVNFDGVASKPGPRQLGDWDLRDYFRQSRQAPYHGIEPVGRAIDRAIPLATECHHLAFQLIEPATMQHSALLVQQADRFSARMALPLDAETSLMRIKFDSRSPRWCTRSAARLTTSVAMSPPDFDNDIVGVEVVVAAHHRLAPLRRAAGRGPISQHREPAVVK
jgi:hypothetical protein